MDTPQGKAAKRLGAYYTEPDIAEILVRWAIRHREDKVIDPSFGGGIFLEAAARCLEQLGGSPENIYGVELDASVHAQISLELHSQSGLNPKQLLQADFFDLEPKHLIECDAVVGNPPFIRYQGFTKNRNQALRQVQKQGLSLSKLSSSWAAFIIHATAFLKPGGRLAMIAPAELGHAQYAKPVLEHLLKAFGQVTLVSFQETLFPKLNQETIFILAEDKGKPASKVLLQYANSIQTITTPQHSEWIATEELLGSHHALRFYALPREARTLYTQLARSSLVKQLSDIAHIGIGYVTGNNQFFHLSDTQAKQWKLSKHLLKPAVYKSRAFQGLDFTVEDWQQAEQHHEAGYLLHLDHKTPLSTALRKYLEYGESQNIHQAYKCRKRSPWYAVPHVYKADAFLSYMNGTRALLVANQAKAVAPNTLHVLRLKTDDFTANDLSALWHNSLTMLSTEIEGHALGGGLLKLEPGEAKKVLVPKIKSIPIAFKHKLDKLLRQGKAQEATALGNSTLLLKSLGLSQADIEILLSAAQQLQEQRSR